MTDRLLATEWMGISAMKNNFGYLLKEGFRGIFHHGFMSFAAVFVTVACLLIVGSFFALTYNLGLIVDDLNQTNEVLVFVDENLSDAEAKSVGTDINNVINIEKAEFVSREEAKEAYAAKQDEPGVFDGLSTETFRHRFRVFLSDNSLLDETKEDLMAVPGVVKIRAAEEVAKLFVMIQNILRVFSLIVIGALLIVSLIIISNTVKLAMSARRDEIAIMKMVGATNGFIRLPFAVQGFVLGMSGAGVAFGLEWLLYNLVVSRLGNMGAGDFLKMEPFQELLLPMIIVFAGAGMFVGLVGSFTSIRKYMKV